MVTDATCFMGWIAEQYGLKLPREYKVKDSCTKPYGDVNDVNKEGEECRKVSSFTFTFNNTQLAAVLAFFKIHPFSKVRVSL